MTARRNGLNLNDFGYFLAMFLVLSAHRATYLFGAPSCVPSCSPDIETSGACLGSDDISRLMERDDIGFLGEMMNYPGVLADDKEVMAKLEA